MKYLLFGTICLVILALAFGGSDMRTPITEPGFDNIPTLIDISGAEMVVSDGAEQAFYTVAIPRNTLGLTNRLVRVELPYVALNSSGGVKTITWKVYYGASAAATTPVDNWAHSGNTRSGKFYVWLYNTGAVNTQQLFGRHEALSGIVCLLGTGEDSLKELNLRVTVTFSAANANLWIQRQVAMTTQMAP